MRLAVALCRQAGASGRLSRYQNVSADAHRDGRSQRRPPAETAGRRDGRPTLFLSYAGPDALTAHSPAAELAPYGYACLLEQAPKEDNDAWLAATAAAPGRAYAVLLLVGEQTAGDRWQRLEYLAADRQKSILALCLKPEARLPGYLAPKVPQFHLPHPDGNVGEADGDGLATLLLHLPPLPSPGDHSWVNEAEALLNWQYGVRAASREDLSSEQRLDFLGFRVVRRPPSHPEQ